MPKRQCSPESVFRRNRLTKQFPIAIRFMRVNESVRKHHSLPSGDGKYGSLPSYIAFLTVVLRRIYLSAAICIFRTVRQAGPTCIRLSDVLQTFLSTVRCRLAFGRDNVQDGTFRSRGNSISKVTTVHCTMSFVLQCDGNRRPVPPALCLHFVLPQV